MPAVFFYYNRFNTKSVDFRYERPLSRGGHGFSQTNRDKGSLGRISAYFAEIQTALLITLRFYSPLSSPINKCLL